MGFLKYIGPRIRYVAQGKKGVSIEGFADSDNGDGVRYHSDLSKATREYKKKSKALAIAPIINTDQQIQ